MRFSFVLRRKAFTLIELLVVIAIIAILAAILFPVFAQAKMAAKKSVAVSNMKQASTAMFLYAGDYDDMAPLLWALGNPVNGGTAPQMPFEVQLYPYTKSYDVFHSPADSAAVNAAYATPGYMFDMKLKDKKRSFAYPVALATQERWNAAGDVFDPNTGMSNGNNARSMTSMSDVANTVALVEVWPYGQGSVNWSMGTWAGAGFQGCDLAKLAGRKLPSTAPGDQLVPGCAGAWQNFTPTTGYAGQTPYAFADGHAKSMGWGAIRKNDFAAFKIVKPDATFNP